MVHAAGSIPIHLAMPSPLLVEMMFSAALTLVCFAFCKDALLTNPYLYQYQYEYVDFVAFAKNTRDNLPLTSAKIVP
jgi:hypothetical protein